MQEHFVPYPVTASSFSDRRHASVAERLRFSVMIYFEFLMCYTPVAQDSRRISGQPQMNQYDLNVVTSAENWSFLVYSPVKDCFLSGEIILLIRFIE